MSASPAVAHLRAALVALHIVAIAGMSLPSPVGFVSGDALDAPQTEKAMAGWAEHLAAVGVPPAATRGWIVASGTALERAEGRFERWFRPYARYAGVRQSWRMFASAPAKAARLEIRVREGGAWRLVYRPFDPDARWRAALWEDGRVRGMVHVITGHRYTAWWEAFAHSVARRAAADFPEADAVRVLRIPLKIPPPERLAEQGRLAEGEPNHVVEVTW